MSMGYLKYILKLLDESPKSIVRKYPLLLLLLIVIIFFLTFSFYTKKEIAYSKYILLIFIILALSNLSDPYEGKGWWLIKK